MRLATYNVEWFNTLFDNDEALVLDDQWSSRWNVTKAAQANALGTVFKALDADAVMIIEAPDTSRKRDAILALEQFAAHFGLRTTTALTGFTNDTQQEIALLYDPNVLSAAHAPGGSEEYPAFDQTFDMDIDIDARTDPIVWSKPPLEVALTPKAGAPMHLIGVHAKSKAPHGARDEKQATAMSIANRRKQLAQCIWLRGRVEERLQAGENLVVMGDFNDGPGLDEYEKLFGRSSIEIVLGEGAEHALKLFDPHAHQALTQPLGPRVATSRFFMRKQKRYLNALLDYIMVSPRLTGNWHVWHPFDDPECWGNNDLSAALLTASDHFPVTIDF
ncbi:MAG: endonuclease/exonuclease/phosphatase family protein [Litoreibacter sp.]